MMTRNAHSSHSSHNSHNPLQTAILGTLLWAEWGVQTLGLPGVLTYTDRKAKPSYGEEA